MKINRCEQCSKNAEDIRQYGYPRRAPCAVHLQVPGGPAELVCGNGGAESYVRYPPPDYAGQLRLLGYDVGSADKDR